MGCREDPSPGSAPTSSSGARRDRGCGSPVPLGSWPRQSTQQVFGPMTSSWLHNPPCHAASRAAWLCQPRPGARTATAARPGEAGEQKSLIVVLTPHGHAASRSEGGSLGRSHYQRLVSLCPGQPRRSPSPTARAASVRLRARTPGGRTEAACAERAARPPAGRVTELQLQPPLALQMAIEVPGRKGSHIPSETAWHAARA